MNEKFDGKRRMKKLGEVIEKSQTENKIPQPALEHTQLLQLIEKNEGVIYDTELENTLKSIKNNTGFFKTNENRGRCWIWNGYLFKKLGGTETETNENRYDITAGIRKALTDSTYKTAKAMNDKDKTVFKDFFSKN